MNADKAANTFTSEPTRHDTQDRSQAPVPTPDGTSALSGDLETVVSAEAVERATSRPGSPQIKGGIIGVAPTEAPSERYAAKNDGFSQADGASSGDQANPTSLAPVGDTGASSLPIADTQ